MGRDNEEPAVTSLQHEVIRIPPIGNAGHDVLKRQCFDLRIAVFVHEQGFPLDAEIDQDDEASSTAHFLLRLLPSHTPVGTVRAVTVNTPTTRARAPLGYPALAETRAANAESESPKTPPLAPLSPKKTHSLKYATQEDGERLAIRAREDSGWNSGEAEELEHCYYKLGRLVVLKEFRQHHLGRALVLAVHEWARAQQQPHITINPTSARCPSPSPARSVRIVAHSQLPVVNFYAKYGYIPEGDIFDEDGAPHRRMVALLPVSLAQAEHGDTPVRTMNLEHHHTSLSPITQP